MDRQLALSQHPAAQRHLPQPVAFAQALIKGWLFYHEKTPPSELPPGVAHAHCRGFWCERQELEQIEGEQFLLLPRLDWLAPAKTAVALDRAALRTALTAHFAQNRTPALVAIVAPRDNAMLEVERGFIVPDDWRSRAEARLGRS